MTEEDTEVEVEILEETEMIDVTAIVIITVRRKTVQAEVEATIKKKDIEREVHQKAIDRLHDY